MLGAGGAALVASLFARDEAKAGHNSTNVFHLGEVNNAPGPTGLVGDSDSPLLSVSNDGDGPGINVASSSESAAITALGSDMGIFAGSPAGNAVHAATSTGSALDGLANGTGNGVHGSSLTTGNGVQGSSEAGNGVAGDSDTGTAGRFESPNGTALQVHGTAMFSTAGSATVPTGQDSVFVANPAITANSHITVTLVSDPGKLHVGWVDRDPGSGFTVHVSGKVKNSGPALALTYLIVEPAV